VLDLAAKKLLFNHQLVVEAGQITIVIVFKDQLAWFPGAARLDKHTRSILALEIF